MSLLISLPTDLFHALVIDNWLQSVDLVVLDISFCNILERPVFLEALDHKVFDDKDVSYHTYNTQYLSWIGVRNICLRRMYLIHESFSTVIFKLNYSKVTSLYIDGDQREAKKNDNGIELWKHQPTIRYRNTLEFHADLVKVIDLCANLKSFTVASLYDFNETVVGSINSELMHNLTHISFFKCCNLSGHGLTKYRKNWTFKSVIVSKK
jgi:hypothetical protein